MRQLSGQASYDASGTSRVPALPGRLQIAQHEVLGELRNTLSPAGTAEFILPFRGRHQLKQRLHMLRKNSVLYQGTTLVVP
jgi:hypothetical protein